MCSLLQLPIPGTRQRPAQHVLYVRLLAFPTADVQVSDPMSGLVRAIPRGKNNVVSDTLNLHNKELLGFSHRK